MKIFSIYEASLLSECDMQIVIIKEKCINEYIKWKETNERNELSIYIRSLHNLPH